MRLCTCSRKPFNGSVFLRSMVENRIGIGKKKKTFRNPEQTNRNEHLSTFSYKREELGRKAIKIIRSRCYWWIKYGFAANFTDECWKVTVEYRRDRIANVRVLLLAAGNLRAHPSRREFRHWCGCAEEKTKGKMENQPCVTFMVCPRHDCKTHAWASLSDAAMNRRDNKCKKMPEEGRGVG